MKRFFWLLIFSAMLFSCGEYMKIKKNTNAEFKLNKAIEYYNKEEYAKTVDLLDDIRFLYRGRSKAQTVDYYYAYALYEQRQYMLAGRYFYKLMKLYPNGPYAEESLYMSAYSYYKEAPRPLLDQSLTDETIDLFQLYIRRYPASSRIEKSKELIAELKDRLAKKSYLGAKTYYDREFYDSSIIALQNSLRDYPESSYRENILFMLLESRYNLAKKSVPKKKHDRYNLALEEYYAFSEEYPESKYSARAERIKKEITKYLGIKE